MTNYILRRLIAVPFMLLGMSFILFVLLWLRPGSAAFASVASIGDFQGELEIFEEQLGLNRPWYVQYLDWLWNALQGDFGTSLIPPNDSVSSLISERVGNTIEIGILAILIGALIGIPTGVFAAVKRNSALDYGLRAFTIAGISIPNFWMATLLIVLPAIWWDWTPISSEYVEFTEDPIGNLKVVIWPALVIAYGGNAAYTARIVRTSMLDVFHTDYIRTARAKGLSERVVTVHAFRNALISVVTVIGLQVAVILGGAVIAEQIFAIPGLGLLTYQSVLLQDYPVLLASILMFSFIFLIVSLAVDLAYTFVDPRIRY